MLQLKNRYLLFFGALFACSLYLLWFYIIFNQLFEIVFLKQNRLELSYLFATIPIQLWIFSIFLLGAFFIISRGKLHIPHRFKRNYMSTIPICALFLCVLSGFFLKPVLVEYLLNNGYELEKTVKASRPWYFDKDIYVNPRI